MNTRVTGSTSPPWAQLLLPVWFYLGAKLSLALAVMPEVLVVLWIPNSILLTGLLHYGTRRYALFAASVILAEVVADYPTFSLAESVIFGGINVLEVSVAYALLQQWRFDPRFATPADIGKFVIAGPVVAAFVSACAAAFTYSYFRGGETSYVEFLRVWWFSDGIGLLLLTPLTLSLWPPVPRAPEPRTDFHWYDLLALVLALAVLVPFAFSYQRTFHGITVRSFFLLPPALYVAARFNIRAAAAAVLAIAGLVLFLTKIGRQPFGDVSIRETVMSAQELIFIMSTMALGVAALLTQHRRTTRDLEHRVQERTAALSEANEQLRRLAILDPLTGTLNRRALFGRLHDEIARGRRHPHDLAVIVFDLDHFKEVNDVHGHMAGDAVLRAVAAIAHQVLRSVDMIARYGGEEFVIVAPDTDRDSAVQLAERLRLLVRARDVAVDGKLLRVTASFGVTTLRQNDEVEDLIRRADEALYAAKAAGRDRVVCNDAWEPGLAAS